MIYFKNICIAILIIYNIIMGIFQSTSLTSDDVDRSRFYTLERRGSLLILAFNVMTIAFLVYLCLLES